jgi:SPP1 gp7 family putative phage head morphogenesis protein
MTFRANNAPVTRAVRGKSGKYAALEARTEGKIRKQARVAFRLMRDGVDIDGVTAGIEAREWKTAYQATGIETTAASIGEIEPHIEEAFVKAADITLDEVEIPEGFVFNPMAPHVRKAIAQQVGQNIAAVTQNTLDNVRAIVSDAISTGRHPYSAAKQIKQVVGLTPKQAQSVENFRKQLVDEGVVGDKLEKRVARYAERKLAQRAEAIARTETATALNNGRMELWTQLQAEGGLPHDQKHKWITAEDERVCNICGPLDGKTVLIGQPFPGGYSGPPAHVMCRCNTVLVAG